MKQRFFIALFLLFNLLLSSLLVSCGSGGGTPTRGDAIIYVAVPLSGFQANGGQTVLGGVRLAAEEINRSGGLLGYKLVVRPLDDESDSDVALAQVDAIQEAISKGDKVIAVIGHLNSGQTAAAMDRYKSMPFLVITPTASEQSLTRMGYQNFFRVNASDDVQARVDADFLANTLGAKNVAVIYNETEYGRGLARSLVTELKNRSVAVALEAEVKEGQNRFASEVAKIKGSGADAIFYAGYEIETPYLRAELVEAGVTVPMLASDGAFLGATIDEANGKAEGLYVSAFAPSPRALNNAKWFEAYQAVEYRNPDTYSVNGYVAVQVLAEGAKKANSIESQAISNALHGGSVSTLLDTLSYDDNGDLTDAKIWIYQVKDGEFQQTK